MALQAKLANLDGLDDHIKPLYVQKDGSFVLDVDSVDGWGLEDVTNLRSALSRLKDQTAKQKQSLDAFGDLKPEEAAHLSARVTEFEAMDPDKMANQKFAARQKQLSEKHRKEVEDLNASIRGIESRLEQVLVDNAAIEAIGDQGSAKLLLPHIRSQVDLVKLGDGDYVVKVKGADGFAQVSNKAGSTSDMTIKELVQQMKGQDDFAPAFFGTGHSGSGAHQNSSHAGNTSNPGGGYPGGGPIKTIFASDQYAIDANHEGISNGTISVVPD